MSDKTGSKIKKVVVGLFPLFAVLTVVLLWWIISLAVGERLLVPSPLQTFAEGFLLLTKSQFWQAYFMTLLRCLIAMGASFVIALALAVLTLVKPAIKKFLSPLIGILRATPTMAIILIVILWAKGMWTPVIAAAIILFPTMYSAFSTAIELDPQLVEMARAFQVPKSKMIKQMLLPKMIPEMTESLAAGFSLSLKLVVSGEVLSQSAKSLGGLMQQASSYLDTPTLFALTLAAVVTGLIVEYSVRFAVRMSLQCSRKRRANRGGESV